MNPQMMQMLLAMQQGRGQPGQPMPQPGGGAPMGAPEGMGGPLANGPMGAAPGGPGGYLGGMLGGMDPRVMGLLGAMGQMGQQPGMQGPQMPRMPGPPQMPMGGGPGMAQQMPMWQQPWRRA